MTKKGESPLPGDLLEVMARLYHLHMLLHPDRVGRVYGVSAEYVRRQWRNKPLPPPAPEWQEVVRLVSER